MNSQFNKVGLHQVKRKNHRKGLRAFNKQIHTQKQLNPALSVLGMKALETIKRKMKKGI